MEALCKQLLGHPALGLPGRKMQFGTSRPGLQVGARVFCLQEPSMVQTGLGS